MKAILEFNLPEDREEFELATKAGELSSAMIEFYQALRGMWKYECDKWHQDTVEHVRELWCQATEGLGDLL